MMLACCIGLVLLLAGCAPSLSIKTTAPDGSTCTASSSGGFLTNSMNPKMAACGGSASADSNIVDAAMLANFMAILMKALPVMATPQNHEPSTTQ
jgi:hypothetical protein